MNDFIINRLFGALVWPLKVVSCLPFFNCDDCGDSIIHVLVTLHNKMCQPIPYVKALKNNVIDNCKALLIKQRIITERFSWLLKVSSTEKMISTKFSIFLLLVILDCNNAVLARSLNPTRFFSSFYETNLKPVIIDNDSKDIGRKEFDAEAQKILEDLKKLTCLIVYPMPCTNIRLKITSSEGTRKTTAKPKQKRAKKNKNKVNFMLRPMKWNVTLKRNEDWNHKITFCCLLNKFNFNISSLHVIELQISGWCRSVY